MTTRLALGALFGVFAATAAVSLVHAEPAPEWAYPLNPGGPPKPPADTGAQLHVPDSDVALTLKEILNRFAAVDWRPASHPAMPESVAHGRAPDLFACGYCHYPNGQGRPENAALAGLPAAYIVEQVEAIRTGARKSSEPAMVAIKLMTKMAEHANPDEVAAAAAYYSGLKFQPWIRVVETEEAPQVEKHGVSAWAAVADAPREPIGERIVEVPADVARTDLRDDRSGFIAYVPVGAVARGAALASTAAGERQPCATCHGEGLRGGEIGPPLAGRSPSYLFRQLHDIQTGARSGTGVEPMKAELAGLTGGEMRDLVAYVASLAP